MKLVGWVILVVASAVPGMAAFLFQWDRTALAKAYFWLGVSVVFFWSAVALWRREY